MRANALKDLYDGDRGYMFGMTHIPNETHGREFGVAETTAIPLLMQEILAKEYHDLLTVRTFARRFLVDMMNYTRSEDWIDIKRQDEAPDATVFMKAFQSSISIDPIPISKFTSDEQRVIHSDADDALQLYHLLTAADVVVVPSLLQLDMNFTYTQQSVT